MMEQKTSDLAHNAALMVLARFAMLGVGMMLPVVGWLLIRGVNSVDEIAGKVETIRENIIETGGNVKLIQQTQIIQGQVLQDHEARVRMLERPKSPP